MKDTNDTSGLKNRFERGELYHRTQIRELAPFTHLNGPTAVELQQFKERVASVGIRALPYPFHSAVSIVSDIDGSTRARSEAYTEYLVGRLGLDFGDSIWLHWRFVGRDPSPFSREFGFFNRRYGIDGGSPSLYEFTRTFAENVRQYHLGNVDHFHSFLPFGPRAVICETPIVQGSVVRIDLEALEMDGGWRAKDLLLMGVTFVCPPAAASAVKRVSAVCSNGSTYEYHAAPHAYWSAGSEQIQRPLYLAGSETIEDVVAPEFHPSLRIFIECENPEAARSISRVSLLSTYGQLILSRLAWLRKNFSISMQLATDHSGYQFRQRPAGLAKDKMQRAHLPPLTVKLEAIWGRIVDEQGELLVCTTVDDPDSTCRLFPDLVEDLDFRFCIPAGYTSASPNGVSPFALVKQALTRTGSGIYVAARILPNIKAPLKGDLYDRTTKSQLDSFMQRVAKILEGATNEPGLAWPLYTHIGACTYDSPFLDAKQLPSPYFEGNQLLLLQNRVFNISANIPEGERIWFTRASTLYDYALMLRSLPTNVRRDGGNTVYISSWLDEILGKVMPQSAAQLYGITFYVDEAQVARVFLDGNEIEFLFRNAPDLSGKPSVTIAECEIKHALLGRCDSAGTACSPEGVWRWHPDPDGYWRISGTREATVNIPLFSMCVEGSQALTFRMRRFGNVRAGIVLQTESGGLFFFGELQARQDLRERLSAHYDVSLSSNWQQFAIPLHDLTWHDGTPGGPFPSNALKSITIVCFGEGQLDISDLALLRPRGSTPVSRSAGPFVVGGRVLAERFTGVTIHVQSTANDDEGFVATTDARGFFCVGGIPRGVYRVWSECEDGIYYSRRGQLIMIDTNIVNLDLDKPLPRSQVASSSLPGDGLLSRHSQ